MIPPLLLRLALAVCVAPVARVVPATREEWTYQFSSPADFADFEVVTGRWAVATGTLACSTKGADDEVAWRRQLSLPATVTVQLATKGRFTLRTTSATSFVDVQLHRAKGTFQVLQGDQVLLEGYFPTPPPGPLTVQVGMARGQVSVQVEDDKVHPVTLREPLLGKARLSLLSHRSQSRIQALTVRRAEAPVEEGATPVDRKAEETRDLLLEDATHLGEAGEWKKAWKVLEPLLATTGSWQELPTGVLRLVNRVALEEPRLREEPPLSDWLAASRLRSQDATVSVQRPLDGTWTGEAPVARRLDGVLWRMECRAPAIRVELHRYDHRVRYWFGEEPRTHFVPGSSASALARARAADQLVERAEARLVVEPRRSDLRLGGETTTEHVLRHLIEAKSDDIREVREYHVVHRGNAHRLTIEGTPEALQDRADELRWILRTLTWHNP